MAATNKHRHRELVTGHTQGQRIQRDKKQNNNWVKNPPTTGEWYDDNPAVAAADDDDDAAPLPVEELSGVGFLRRGFPKRGFRGRMTTTTTTLTVLCGISNADWQDEKAGESVEPLKC